METVREHEHLGIEHEEYGQMKASVGRGAALLDEGLPGWRDRVDVHTLNMRSPSHCVLGQLYSSFWDGRAVLGLGYHAAIEHGFNAETMSGGSDWDTLIRALDHLWIDEINREDEVPPAASR